MFKRDEFLLSGESFNFLRHVLLFQPRNLYVREIRRGKTNEKWMTLFSYALQ